MSPIEQIPARAVDGAMGAVGERPATGPGSFMDHLPVQVDALMSLTRKNKPPIADITKFMAGFAERAKLEGVRAAEINAAQTQAHVARLTDEKVLCGFIAEVNEAEKTYRGLPTGMIWTLNSFTVSKIVDALNRVGYSADGFRTPRS